MCVGPLERPLGDTRDRMWSGPRARSPDALNPFTIRQVGFGVNRDRGELVENSAISAMPRKRPTTVSGPHVVMGPVAEVKCPSARGSFVGGGRLRIRSEQGNFGYYCWRQRRVEPDWFVEKRRP